MDPHFSEYLAAIAGMRATYGDRSDEHPSDFHDDHGVSHADAQAVTAAAA